MCVLNVSEKAGFVLRLKAAHRTDEQTDFLRSLPGNSIHRHTPHVGSVHVAAVSDVQPCLASAAPIKIKATVLSVSRRQVIFI